MASHKWCPDTRTGNPQDKTEGTAHKASMKNHSVLFLSLFIFSLPIISLACYFVNICFFSPCPVGRFPVYFLGTYILFYPVVFPTSLHLIFVHIPFCLHEKHSLMWVSNGWKVSPGKASLCVLGGLPQGTFWPTCTLFIELWNLLSLLTSRRIFTEQRWVKWGTWTDGEEPVVPLQVHFPRWNVSMPGGAHCLQVTHIV